MNKVLWNNEMDLCIGLSTEMDEEEFRDEAQRTHLALTGESLPIDCCTVSMVQDDTIWWLEFKWE